jgi:hypothetical protein
MALTRSITSLITDGRDYATKEFLTLSPETWASEHMASRYGHTHLPTDHEDSFANLCFEFLKEEYRSLRSWFTDDGKFSPLLQSKFMTTRLSGPVGNGIGWDFMPNGDPEPRMLQFKGTLISAQRSAELIPPASRNSGNMQFGGIVKIVRSAYTARAELHSWRQQSSDNGLKCSGAEMSRRWVAFRTYTFLITMGAEPVWAWEASRCKAIFGMVDEDKATY